MSELATAEATRTTPGSAPDPVPAPARSAFRPDIQGLRAIAVAMVVLYHLYPKALPGGFAGVDVFFVISGYLITGHLWRDYAATGKISLVGFWGRRARRLVPAAALVLVVTWAVSRLVLPATRLADTAQQILASALYFQNWQLARDAVDYLKSNDAASPVQHFWSLSVEEQFYLVWPLLFGLAALTAVVLARARRGPRGRACAPADTARTRRTTVAVLTTALVAGSLAYSVWDTQRDPSAAYFVTTTRMWELGAGGLLALAPARVSGWLEGRRWLAWAGLAAVAASAFALNGSMPFPGDLALLPVLGAVAIIAAGSPAPAGRRTGPGRLLSSRPMVFLGGISYSLYLWHYPVINLFTAWHGQAPGPLPGLALLAVSTGLAWLSKRYVEDPVRLARALRGHGWRSVSVALAAAVPVALAATYIAGEPGPWNGRLGPDYPGAAALASSPSKQAPARSVLPPPAQASAPGYWARGCLDGQNAARPTPCVFGDTTHPVLTVALVGDSIAGNWWAALNVIAQRRHWKLVTDLHGSCAWSQTTAVTPGKGGPDTACTAWGHSVLHDLLTTIRPQLVITSADAAEEAYGYPRGSARSRAAIGAGEAAYWKQLKARRISVAAIRATPDPGIDAPACVERYGAGSSRCDAPKSAAIAAGPPSATAARMAGVPVIDMNDLVCTASECPPVVGNVLVYFDTHHFTQAYSQTLAPFLERRLLASGAVPRRLPDGRRCQDPGTLRDNSRPVKSGTVHTRMRPMTVRHRSTAVAWTALVIACLATASCVLSPGTAGSGQGGSEGALAQDAIPSVALWPRLTPARTLLTADASSLSGPDLLTATTLQGVYNGSQQASRLYLSESPSDQFWLRHLPSGVRVRNLPAEGSSGSLLRALLTRFRAAVKGAIVADPSNPDTVNLATTMAGLDDSVVIYPSQENLVKSLGIPVRYSFDTPQFTADNPVQTYHWGIANLLPKTSTKVEVALSGTTYGTIRDYAVASKAFVYWLTSTDPNQKPLLDTVTAHTPANTPVMGYLPVENPDVAEISTAGHFLDGSNTVTNESVWASMPSPASLRQPTEPAPIRADPGTVYVAFLMSDGDNEGLLQSRLPAIWSDPDFGTVPAGWTVAPGALEYDPAMMQYLYRTLSPDSEFVAAPSGIGYVSEETGPDLARFDQLTDEIMARDDLKTIDTYEPPNQLAAQAGNASGSGAVPAGGSGGAAPAPAALSKNTPLLPEQSGRTFISGQTSGYIGNTESQYCAIGQQAATEQRTSAPLFLEPMIDAYHYGPADLLHMAQQLARAGQAAGVHVVFTTPTELALTEQRYYDGRESGLPAGNAQSETGAQALARPSAGPDYPSRPATVTGPNLVRNPSGASGTSGWSVNGGNLQATSYQGQPALHWTSDVEANQSWADYVPTLTNGKTYTFTADVAGSGQVFLDGYNGQDDEDTLPVRLTSHYQKLTWTVTVPAKAAGPSDPYYAPQLEIRQSGGPVSVYISGASIAASTAPC